MQASTKDDSQIAKMLRTVAMAEKSRPIPEVPPRLALWLENQIPVKTSIWSKWIVFFQNLAAYFFTDATTTSTQRRLSLRIGVAGILSGAVLGGGAITLLNRRSMQVRDGVPAWVSAIEQYQSLYVRDTVLGAPQSPEQTQAVLLAFTSTASLPRFKVPDLSHLGLSFQRAQRLNFNDMPLLQIVYLPKEGRPVALCVMPAIQVKLNIQGADMLVKTNTAYGMTSAHWQKNDLALVVVADWKKEQLHAVTTLVQQQV